MQAICLQLGPYYSRRQMWRFDGYAQGAKHHKSFFGCFYCGAAVTAIVEIEDAGCKEGWSRHYVQRRHGVSYQPMEVYKCSNQLIVFVSSRVFATSP